MNENLVKKLRPLILRSIRSAVNAIVDTVSMSVEKSRRTTFLEVVDRKFNESIYPTVDCALNNHSAPGCIVDHLQEFVYWFLNDIASKGKLAIHSSKYEIFDQEMEQIIEEWDNAFPEFVLDAMDELGCLPDNVNPEVEGSEVDSSRSEEQHKDQRHHQ